jgi:RimJ/RimL family protein N-acetyltransferase
VVLALDDLLLRPWEEADAEVLCMACQDPDIRRWVSIPEPFSLADAQAQIADWQQLWTDGSGAPFAVVDATSGHLLGAVVRIGPDGHQATLGCWVVPEARGRGIGTRVLRGVADWTFETTDVVRIDAYIMLGNEASERMTRRAGFRREGVLRAWELLRGDPVDCVVYSRLRDDD